MFLIFKKMLYREIAQDDRVGRPSVHFLSWVHQNYNYLKSNDWWERPESSRKKNLQVIYREEIMRHIGGVRSKFPGGQPTNERLTAIVEVFPKKQWFWVLHWASQPRGPAPVRLTPPEHLSMKASRAYFWKTQRTVGNRDSILKGQTQNFPWSKAEAEIWKKPGSDPLADLKEFPREARGN